ncbi:MAG: ATP-dependent OLD family endonuclease [uncultured bacterium]|nr:MAG: ATP-dependent OLD family endonuclease [uncultured bacterium]HBR79367.1 hypothetical protein [Candidatus Moranbacteria bacterium]
MKLENITIKNYKSINEVTVDMSQSDNILALIGQNESGKSSILEAIRDYYQGSFHKDSFPYNSQANLGQNVSCTFSFDQNDDREEIQNQIEEFANKVIYETAVKFKKNILKNIDSFSVSFNGNNYELNDSLKGIIINSLEIAVEAENDDTITVGDVDSVPSAEENEGAEEIEEEKPIIDGNLLFSDLPEFLVKNIVPEFIFFEGGKCDMLPDFISVESLINKDGNGWVAVTWLEKCLQELTGDKELSFKNLSEVTSLQRRDQINDRVSEITADFKDDFSQKIHGIENDNLSIEFNIEKRAEEDSIVKDYIDFAVKTIEGKVLPVRMRSQGMIWFLSFWLALKSLKEKKSIILVDEPDRSLHINAQKDLLSVFEKISNKFKHQIIYTTHAPSLVPLETVFRIYLVFNDKDDGTLCENILKTQIGNSKNKQEAISLVNYAIGCEVPHENLIFKKNNVIVEGLSDFMHIQAMAKILNKKLEYALIPGVGTRGSKLNPLIGICIGYNLNWCVILDGDTAGQDKFDELKDSVFAGNIEKAEMKIKKLKVNNIEDLFTLADIQLIADGSRNIVLGKKPKEKNNLSYIGKQRKNVFAKLFLEKAQKNDIGISDLNKITIKNFEELFSFAESALGADEFEYDEK